MIEQLFGSKTRVKLLHLFYTNPNRSFFVREITRKVDEQINSVRRELANLLSIGLIKSDTNGNKLYYEVNQKYKHYEALRAMFTGISSTKEPVIVGAHDYIAKFKDLGSVDLAILTGVFVRNKLAPVDILIVGDVNKNKVEKLIQELEQEEGESLRYTVLSREDYDYRLNLNDRFITTVLEGKKTILIDRISEPEAQEPKKPLQTDKKPKKEK